MGGCSRRRQPPRRRASAARAAARRRLPPPAAADDGAPPPADARGRARRRRGRGGGGRARGRERRRPRVAAPEARREEEEGGGREVTLRAIADSYRVTIHGAGVGRAREPSSPPPIPNPGCRAAARRTTIVGDGDAHVRGVGEVPRGVGGLCARHDVGDRSRSENGPSQQRLSSVATFTNSSSPKSCVQSSSATDAVEAVEVPHVVDVDRALRPAAPVAA